MEQHGPRKLAVVLHADVVGSTSLVQRDETLAHQRIQDVFQRRFEIIRAYGGGARRGRAMNQNPGILQKLGCLLLCLALASPSWIQAAPLHDAARASDAGKIEQLLQEGADVNASDALGTPLHWAIMSDHSNAVQLLLVRGADANAIGALGTPLYQATLKGDTDLVRLLLEHGADPNGGQSDAQARRSTPLHEAARNGYIAVARMLLEANADANVATFEGQTPLHNAANVGQLEIVKLLVHHAADVNALNAAGEPPVHLAKRNEHEVVAEFLIVNGATAPTVTPIFERLGSADLAKGKRQVGFCTECHFLEKGKNKIGPSLWNIVGRQKASLDDFTYSPAMLAQEGSWDYEALNAFIAHPTATVPGTKMQFSGMPKPQDRVDLILYLRALSADPVPLP